MEIVVFSPIALGLTFAVVQFAKKFGLNPYLAPIVELGFGGGLIVVGFASGVVIVSGDLPGSPWFWVSLQALMTGLSAAGVYTDKRTATGSATTP